MLLLLVFFQPIFFPHPNFSPGAGIAITVVKYGFLLKELKVIAKEWKKIFSSKFRMSLISSLCLMICACSTNPASFNSQNNTGSSPRFHVADGSIYDHDKKIFLKGVNWFGFDTEYLDLHGLWSGKYS